MDSEFLTAEEVAEYLRLPLSTVYKLVQDKRLPGFKVGKHWRFRKETFEEWIREQENASTASSFGETRK
jgi:excisionase family DNA binding protein